MDAGRRLSGIFRRGSFVLILLPVLFLWEGCEARTFREQLTEKLSFERHFTQNSETLPANSVNAFYILGGRQNNLELKIQQVGRLYTTGNTRKVFFLHRKGITEFSRKLRRNYTNDEWATEYLKQVGVKAGNLEFVIAPFSIFSTFAEARVVSSLARAQGVKRLILVTSRHHTARTWSSFSQCNRDNQLDLYIYSVETKTGTFDLIIEALKLLTYRLLAFPLDRLGIRI